MASVLCDVIEDAVASLLVLQPLANEDAGGGGVELAAAQHAVAVSHAVLEGSIVNFTAGIPADTRRRVILKLNPLSIMSTFVFKYTISTAHKTLLMNCSRRFENML